MSDAIVIRRAESLADYRACQAAQRSAWGITDESYVVPVATMVGAQLHGGLVLGAFRPDGAAVGVSFAFLGRIEGRIGLYSQLTGVAPGYQDQGIGGRLKQAQRDFARDQGLALLAWAFDPLQAGNARFNLARLGATAGRYIEDMYGPRTDALNPGLPTDRLIAEWETVARTRPRLTAEAARRLPRLIAACAGSEGAWTAGLVGRPEAPAVLLEIPVEVNALRGSEPALAEQWRLAVRQAFQAAFEVGYRAVDFLSDESDGLPRCFYLLERGEGPSGSG
jgi:predicted GNAT superfamily acetyltransferase